MAEPNDSVGLPPLATLECLSEHQKLFAELLGEQANLFRKRRKTPTLTDREVIHAFDVLVEGRRPHFWVVGLSHTAEIIGGGVLAFGWQFGKTNPNDAFISWTCVVAGCFLFAGGILVREFLARK